MVAQPSMKSPDHHLAVQARRNYNRRRIILPDAGVTGGNQFKRDWLWLLVVVLAFVGLGLYLMLK